MSPGSGHTFACIFRFMPCSLSSASPPMQVYNNMFDAGRGILRERGPLGLYRGLGVTLVEIMPYAALQFGLYDMFTAAWRVSV